jgi:peptidoglycan/LPS O-acetylase OafA/YrhL
MTKQMRNESLPERDLETDALRSFAILYIVGFWHLHPYYSRFTYLFTYCVVGLFLYISGQLLTTKYRCDTMNQVLLFYKRRLFRIYPLFFISLTIFLLMGIIDRETYFISAFLANMFIPRELMTLWFITMLVVFYLLAPLFLHKYSAGKTIILTCLCWAGLVIVHVFTGRIDLRLPMHLLPFVLGIMATRSPHTMNRILKSPAALGICCVVFMLALWQYPAGSDVYQLIVIDMAIVVSMPIFVYIARHSIKWISPSLLTFISYASFVMYLSHKIFFALSGKIFHSQYFLIQVLYYGSLVLPATIVFSYWIQLAYDRLIATRPFPATLTH